MIKIPNKIHTSNVTFISVKDVLCNAGTNCIAPQYTPIRIAPIIILGQDRFNSPNIFS